MPLADWIAVDWGTSRLRLWALESSGRILGTQASDKGMGQLSAEGFEPALLALAAPYLDPTRRTKILICGMAGARQGWHEAPYRQVPCTPVGDGTVQPEVSDPRLDVHILPGLSQQAPPDVMRGEEVQIAGFLMHHPGFDGTLCLPGTHCKWVRVADGCVQSFQTTMTGELFDLMSRQSILRHDLGEGWDTAAFLAASQAACANPELAFSDLFALRAGALLGKPVSKTPRSVLSGLLIGAELSATCKHWQGQKVVVIGAPDLARRYCDALAQQGAKVTDLDGTELVLDGLKACHLQQEGYP